MSSWSQASQDWIGPLAFQLGMRGHPLSVLLNWQNDQYCTLFQQPFPAPHASDLPLHDSYPINIPNPLPSGKSHASWKKVTHHKIHEFILFPFKRYVYLESPTSIY